MKVMVFDVGGTGIKYSVMDEQLNRTDTGSTPTPADSQEHFLNTLREIYLPHKGEVDGIALSLPGFIDAEQGVVKGGGAPSLAYNVGTPVGPRLAEACGYRARKGLPADAPMDGRIFFEAVHAGETEANEALRSFCRAVAVQIYNLNVMLDLEKVAIGGGISKQPILVETLNEVYEEYILRGHPFSEAQACCLPRPEIVPCRFLSEANQIGAFASYQKAFLEN